MTADSQELNLYEFTGRALDDIIEGGEDALRRASEANVGGALQRSNSLLAHRNTWKALKDRAIEAKRKVKAFRSKSGGPIPFNSHFQAAQRTPQTIHEEGDISP